MHRLSIVLVPYLSRKRTNPMTPIGRQVHRLNSERREEELLFGKISVGQYDVVSRRSEALLQSLGDYNRAMAPTRTANSHVQITAALTLEERYEECEELLQSIKKGLRIGVVEHIAANTRIFSGERHEIRHKIRIA